VDPRTGLDGCGNLQKVPIYKIMVHDLPEEIVNHTCLARIQLQNFYLARVFSIFSHCLIWNLLLESFSLVNYFLMLYTASDSLF